MAYFPVELAGGTYKHTDLSLSAQRTINYWPQRQEGGNEKSPFVLESFYGLKSFCSGTGLNRGLFEHRGVAYHLHGTTLSSISSAGVRTTLGTIPGDSRAVFDGIGSSIVITADGVAYEWDGSTLTTATDGDFETPQTVTVLNNQAIYDGDGGRFATSDVGLPLTLNALNYGTAESKADDIVRPFAFGTIVHMFGVKTIEQWWNTGEGTPPFARIEDGTIKIGLGATHTIATDDNSIFFFADDKQVYSLVGSIATPLLPLDIVREIEGFSTISDATAWTMQLDAQWFYVLKFPTADRTFAYPIPKLSPQTIQARGLWFELSSGVTGARYNGDAYTFAYNKHLVADEDGDIFELDIDTFDEDGSAIKRTRILAPIHGGTFGKPGKEVEISFLKLIGATGRGIPTGQGSAPQIMLRYSQDGENFSNEIRGDVGKLGVQTEVVFEIGESFETWVFEITSTDPVYSNWHHAGVEMEISI
jgi:hypothetical protein|tara:strand:- start:1986 stop:3410 length:1425 start_codon:yes stop_codon:yes gene_type:complete